MTHPDRWRSVQTLCLLAGLVLLAGCTKPTQPPAPHHADRLSPLRLSRLRTHPTARPRHPRRCSRRRTSRPTPSAAPSAPSPTTPDAAASPAPEAPVTISNPAALRGLSDEDVALPVQKPAVVLSQQHAASCRVKPDDAFPDLALQTPDGTASRLAEHLGQRLTVVVLWSSQYPMSVEQLSRLEQEVLKPYGGVGVGVVAVNVGDSAESLQKLLSQVDHGFVTLWDRDRQGYGQLATDMMPRTYLLDASGKILWLDVEYSRSTRRELRNAILYHLRQQLQADQQQADPLM